MARYLAKSTAGLGGGRDMAVKDTALTWREERVGGGAREATVDAFIIDDAPLFQIGRLPMRHPYNRMLGSMLAIHAMI